jgi:hypothetical protein
MSRPVYSGQLSQENVICPAIIEGENSNGRSNSESNNYSTRLSQEEGINSAIEGKKNKRFNC